MAIVVCGLVMLSRGHTFTHRLGICFHQELVRLQSMLEDERDLLSFALANIFFAYDREQSERVLLRRDTLL